MTKKEFSITNVSSRLISVMGVFIAPGETKNLEDTELNQATVKDDPHFKVGKAVAEKESAKSETQKNTEDAIKDANSSTGAKWGN